jgi:hypothetical protein
MRIRILAAGPPGAVLAGRPWPDEGTEVEDLPTAAAAHLVASGVAEDITDTPPPARRRKRKADDDDG